jgi:hypothetical protein
MDKIKFFHCLETHFIIFPLNFPLPWLPLVTLARIEFSETAAGTKKQARNAEK